MLGHLKHLVVFGSSLLALGIALLIAVPQTLQRPEGLGHNRSGNRHPTLALPPPARVFFDLPWDPSLDLYELSSVPMLRLYQA